MAWDSTKPAVGSKLSVSNPELLANLVALEGVGFVDRGDPAAIDYTEAGAPFVGNLDGAWHDMDLSAIVPAGAVAVVLAVVITDAAANQILSFRKNGNANAIAIQSLKTQVAAQEKMGCITVACDTSQVIEFLASAGFDSIDVTVVGWHFRVS